MRINKKQLLRSIARSSHVLLVKLFIRMSSLVDMRDGTISRSGSEVNNHFSSNVLLAYIVARKYSMVHIDLA